uniref:Phytocyanin domain-containing protein n=1 Tax=Oryza brachyantha TaxID=4533 RepID=J3MHQ6_ORYBR
MLQLVATCGLLLFLSLPLLRSAAATEYAVGDGPWDSGTNYAAWADKHTFVAGDVLGSSFFFFFFLTCSSCIIAFHFIHDEWIDRIWFGLIWFDLTNDHLVAVFQYVKSQHNVVQVTEATYRSCDTGGGVAGVLKTYTSGYDRVQLTDPNTTYSFICDFPGHCLGGMKLAVKVSAAAAGAGGGSPPPSVVPLRPSGSASQRPPAWGLSLTLAAAGVVVVIKNFIF